MLQVFFCSFLSFFLLLAFPIHVYYTLFVLSHSPSIFHSVYLSLYPLFFSEILLIYPLEILSSGVSDKRMKDIFIPVQCYALCPFWCLFFLGFSSPLTLSICFHMASTLSIRTLGLLSIVILKFWSDYFNIPAISDSCCLF